MDTFTTLLDLEPSPFDGSPSHTSQPNWDDPSQYTEPFDSLPVDQDNLTGSFSSFCVIL
ncbi:hypothetical protein BDR04DRAFT_1087106 [Suillus decipiens]|nr:hypothetical protein BDR04DRAFT_1087106 [Suillus decipiens]